jgi:hypothetical protein
MAGISMLFPAMCRREDHKDHLAFKWCASSAELGIVRTLRECASSGTSNALFYL